ncbi:MAG: MFS transporter [Rhodobacteraceae bacterium]|nr:MFS transporter [Paracoccaceae bacterium]
MALISKNQNFRLLFSASAVSNLGDGISALAFPWLATLITREPVLIATVAAAGRLPWLLFTIPAGVITDRFNRRRLMIHADIFRMIMTFVVVALILGSGPLPLEHNSDVLRMITALSGAAFLLGAAEVLRDNAAQTVLPSIVDTSDLEQANGQIWTIEQIMGSFVGPPLAGFLIAISVPVPFIFDALTFGFASLLLWSVTMTSNGRPVGLPPGFWPQLREGMVWIWNHKLILRLAVMLGWLNLVSVMAVTVLVLFSQEILHLNAAGHGLLLTSGAAGGVAGGLIGPGIIRRLGNQGALRLALALIPFPFLVIYLTDSVVLVAAALFLEMFAALIWNLVTVSLRQRTIPANILGRVNSIYRFFGWGLMPIGAMCGGILVTMAEPEQGREAALRLPYLIAAMSMAIAFVYGVFVLRIPRKKNGSPN